MLKNTNIVVEPFTGPPQVGSRRATPQQSRVSPGRAARGGTACPSGQSSTYVPATIPPTRAPPAAWVALARGTDSTLDSTSMPVGMPGIEEQGATTAASLFVVFKEAVSDDDSVFIDL
jgi:hypothetical protein